LPNDIHIFFGITSVLLVRHGEDEKLPKGRHTLLTVAKEMLLQITRDYNGLGDFRELKWHEILFFYDGLRQELREATKPNG